MRNEKWEKKKQSAHSRLIIPDLNWYFALAATGNAYVSSSGSIICDSGGGGGGDGVLSLFDWHETMNESPRRCSGKGRKVLGRVCLLVEYFYHRMFPAA